MLPTDSLLTDIDDLIVNDRDAVLVVTGKNEKLEIERLIKEAIYSQRRCAKGFYRNANRDDDDEEDDVAVVVDEVVE
jgi:hypothetical protein